MHVIFSIWRQEETHILDPTFSSFRFEQFRTVYMQSDNDKHPAMPGFETDTSSLRVTAE